MLKTNDERQRNNHTIQQSLLKSWINSDTDVSVINLDEAKLRLKKINEPSLKNIKDLLFQTKRSIKTEKIFSNKYILNETEENIDGYGKKVQNIEKDFLREFKFESSFNLNTLYDYFALQLTRSEMNLVTSHKRFCGWFGKISELVTYQQFKAFYNAMLPPQFLSLVKSFKEGNYRGYHMEVSYLFDDKGKTVAPFFWIGEANTFCLGKLKECKCLIPELDGLDLSKVYVCLASNKELIFLYPEDMNMEVLKSVSNLVAINWNKLAMKFVYSTLIIHENGIFSLSRTIKNLLVETNNQFLHMNHDLGHLKDLQRKYEPMLAPKIEIILDLDKTTFKEKEVSI